MSGQNRSTSFLLPLPPSCIRGPELSDTIQIADAIASTDGAALSAYQQGIALIIAVQSIEQDLIRLEELKQTRLFLIEQLQVMEREHPRAFDTIRAAFERQSRQQPSPAVPETPAQREQSSASSLDEAQ